MGDAYAAGSSFTADRSAELDSSVTLYAVWTAASYTVQYDANGANSGTAPAAQTKVHGTNLVVAVNAGEMTRVGYVFAGWNTADNGRGVSYAPGAIYQADADATPPKLPQNSFSVSHTSAVRSARSGTRQ